MIYKCCDEKRKAAVLGNPALNGIDYLEVLGFDAQPLGLAPQTILLVRCLKAAPTTLTPDNILISRRRKHHQHPGDVCHAREYSARNDDSWPQQSYFTSLANAADVLMIGVSTPGDFSPYTLRLVNFGDRSDRGFVRGHGSARRLRSATGRGGILL